MSGVVGPRPEEANDGAIRSCEFRCLAPADMAGKATSDAYVIDGPMLDEDAVAAPAGIVLPREGAARATELLDAGARRVLLGETVLLDGSVVATLAEMYGSERVGVYVPAQRLAVSWSFDTVSNADFKVLTPSVGAPAWEVLRADGSGTGTNALWWIGEMLKLGASEALVRVDISDDADLNLCAECVERFGDRVWFGPLADAAPRLDDWILYGHARRFVLLPSLYAQATAIDAAGPPIYDVCDVPVGRVA